MNKEGYDLIGDIHGEAPALRDLLGRLGYREEQGCYRHPVRRVIFLGDYVDRGPAIRETLWIVRRMVDQAGAVALMGNHEMDVLRHDTPDGRGGFLQRGGHDTANSARTHAEFADRPDEWREWLRWLQTLRLYYEEAGFRAVHAYWSSAAIAALGGRQCLDDHLLFASKETTDGAAVHLLLKGPKVAVPPHEGRPANQVRARWWLDGRSMTYRDYCIAWRGQNSAGPATALDPDLHPQLIPPDPHDTRPIFIGHYWLPFDAAPAPLTSKVACLDYSVAAGGPLVAYRWSGEAELRAENYVFDPVRTGVAESAARM